MTALAIQLSDSAAVVLIACLGGFCVFVAFWAPRRANAMLDAWAVNEGLRIVERRWCRLFTGPFAWRGYMVFRITALWPDGLRKTGWVQCGHDLWGIFKSDVKVRWDEDENT